MFKASDELQTVIDTLNDCFTVEGQYTIDDDNVFENVVVKGCYGFN